MPAILKNVDANSEYQIDYINVLYKTGNLAVARNAVQRVLSDPITNTQQLAKLMDIWSEYDPTPLTVSQISSLSENGSRVMQITLARYFLWSEPQYSAQILTRALNAQLPEAKALLARIMLAEGKTRPAYEIADQILKNDPRNEDASIVASDAPQNVFGYVMLGNALSAKGNKTRARQVFEQGVDALPQSRILAQHYKQLLLSWGDTKRIVSLDKEVALASPSSIKSWTVFGESCSRFGDAFCATEAKQGLARAKLSFVVDDPPGTPRRRGLFARITPEKICATTGGICTES
jgi:tetratricopeptide (TPR) repeat protein